MQTGRSMQCQYSVIVQCNQTPATLSPTLSRGTGRVPWQSPRPFHLYLVISLLPLPPRLQLSLLSPWPSPVTLPASRLPAPPKPRVSDLRIKYLFLHPPPSRTTVSSVLPLPTPTPTTYGRYLLSSADLSFKVPLRVYRDSKRVAGKRRLRNRKKKKKSCVEHFCSPARYSTSAFLLLESAPDWHFIQSTEHQGLEQKNGGIVSAPSPFHHRAALSCSSQPNRFPCLPISIRLLLYQPKRSDAHYRH